MRSIVRRKLPSISDTDPKITNQMMTRRISNWFIMLVGLIRFQETNLWIGDTQNWNSLMKMTSSQRVDPISRSHQQVGTIRRRRARSTSKNASLRSWSLWRWGHSLNLRPSNRWKRPHWKFKENLKSPKGSSLRDQRPNQRSDTISL